MSCRFPLTAWRDSRLGISFIQAKADGAEIQLPCGRCIACRLERSRQWAVRLMHEKQLHDTAMFITFTYSDENLPRDLSLDYRHYRLFMRRLRRSVGKVRFFMCGEYGELNNRPHYHSIIFGHWFRDAVFECNGQSGEPQYSSDLLSQLWGLGRVTFGEVTFESCAYVARYILKKVTGDPAAAHYEYVDLETGQIYARKPEFCVMSRRPGIGAGWYAKFFRDVQSGDFVLSRGRPSKPPRYYDKLYRRMDRKGFEFMKSDREDKAMRLPNRGVELSAERQAVKNEVDVARSKLFRRVL